MKRLQNLKLWEIGAIIFGSVLLLKLSKGKIAFVAENKGNPIGDLPKLNLSDSDEKLTDVISNPAEIQPSLESGVNYLGLDETGTTPVYRDNINFNVSASPINTSPNVGVGPNVVNNYYGSPNEELRASASVGSELQFTNQYFN